MSTFYGLPGVQYVSLRPGSISDPELRAFPYPADDTGLIQNVDALDEANLSAQGCINAEIWSALQGGTARLKQLGGITVYKLQQTDNKCLLVSNAATDVMLIVPYGLLFGFRCEFVAGGTGSVVPAADPAVTINSVDGYLTTSGQYAKLELTGIDQDVYILTGDGAVSY